ncbi:MAG: hypothetical protein M3N98_06365 [Actinomycetota bacterium]|nr:hypothetical protein [Actinomycetota bacterium]
MTIGVWGAKFRRVAVGLVVAVLATGAPRAAWAPVITPLLEPSQSCMTDGQQIDLTLWGSGLYGRHTITDANGDISATSVLGDDRLGNFTVSVTLTPHIVRALYDIFYVDYTVNANGAPTYRAFREVRIATADTPACPNNTPPPNPCVPPGPVPLSTTGLYEPNGQAAGAYQKGADWYLSYPGIGFGPTPFAHSVVGGASGAPGSAAATLPANLATPGSYEVTVIARGNVDQTPVQDVYVTWPITVCTPTPTTATTTSTTTTTTVPHSTTSSSTTVPGVTTTTTTSTTKPAGTQALSVIPAVGPDGIVTQVHGSGFTPGAVVTLEWLPGIGTVTATAGADGTFNTPMLVFVHDQIGQRQVHARTFPATVSAQFLVETGTAVPPNHGASSWVDRH